MGSIITARSPAPLVAGLVLAACALGADTRAAADRAWKVTQGDVRVVCPMTVGGGFEARTRSLTGSVALAAPRPPSFSGALAVDLRTLETGIGLRDSHMREEYLQVGNGNGFETAVLSDIRLGDVDPETFVGRTSFTGSFRLHGTTRPVAGKVEVHRSGSTVSLEASFPVNLPDFGIPKPRYLGVGVKDRVEVHVALKAAPLPAARGES
jgi:polyisoprenoid-binding protein YceI